MASVLVLWTPVALYMAAIFYASSLSVIPAPVSAWFSDTVLHMACYGGLALCTLRALARGKWKGVTVGVTIAAWLLATLYGASDEWHQMYVPGRSAELRDLMNDVRQRRNEASQKNGPVQLRAAPAKAQQNKRQKQKVV